VIEVTGTDVRAWIESSLSLSLSLGRARGRISKFVRGIAAPVNVGKDKGAAHGRHRNWSDPEPTRPRRLAEALRVRAMMRLLRLHARIIGSRWEHERLPTSLNPMLITLTLACIVKLQASSYLKQVIPEPTGNNGYEEYLQAADIVNSKAFKDFKAWNSAPVGRRDTMAPSGLSESSSALARKIYEVRTFGSALKLIAAGNAKSTSRGPREMMTELSRFRDLTQLGIDASYVAYAKGDWKGGRSDCDHIVMFVNGLLGRPSSLSVALDTEEEFARASISSPEFFNGQDVSDDEDSKAFVQRMRILSGSERLLLTGMLKERITKEFGQYRILLQKPEREWVQSPNLAGAEPKQSLVTLTDICDAIHQKSVHFDETIPVGLQVRVQLRLLRLHALIQKFRWMHGRLPAQLGEVSASAEILDPLTGEPFHLEHQLTGYKLYSAGIAGIGEIGLTSKKAK